MTIFGPDISSYQSGLTLANLADAAFVIAKVSEGTYYADPDFAGWRAQAAQIGKPFIWYHFLSGQDATAQAVYTAAKLGSAVSLPGMLDCEPEGSFKPSLAQIVAYVRAAQAEHLNLRLVYLPHWYWQQLGSPDLSELASLGVHLVSSAYPGGTGSAAGLYPGDGAAGWAPYGGMTPLLYQFTNQASDGGQLLDFNAFRGPLTLLETILNGDPNMPLTQQDIDAVVAAVVAKVPPAVYRYGEESVTINGQVVKNVPLGNLAHGAWVALNDPYGAVPQMRGQMNEVFHRAYPTAEEIGAVVEQHLGAGGGASAADIAQAVDALFAQKLGAS